MSGAGEVHAGDQLWRRRHVRTWTPRSLQWLFQRVRSKAEVSCKMAEGKDDGSSSSRNPVDVYLQRANKRRLDIATQGIEFDPQDSDPLSSRMSHRFMFAEFLGSLFYGLISQGCVITSGVLTFQFTIRI